MQKTSSIGAFAWELERLPWPRQLPQVVTELMNWNQGRLLWQAALMSFSAHKEAHPHWSQMLG